MRVRFPQPAPILLPWAHGDKSPWYFNGKDSRLIGVRFATSQSPSGRAETENGVMWRTAGDAGSSPAHGIYMLNSRQWEMSCLPCQCGSGTSFTGWFRVATGRDNEIKQLALLLPLVSRRHIRACSSVGRASALQAEYRRFDSVQVHQIPGNRNPGGTQVKVVGRKLRHNVGPKNHRTGSRESRTSAVAGCPMTGAPKKRGRRLRSSHRLKSGGYDDVSRRPGNGNPAPGPTATYARRKPWGQSGISVNV